MLMFINIEWPNKQMNNNTVFNMIPVDSHFAETFELKLKKGKWWEEGQMKKVVLNEDAVRMMKLDEPVDSIIRMLSTEDNFVMEDYEIAGIVNDFHTLSLRNSINTYIVHSIAISDKHTVCPYRCGSRIRSDT